MNSKVNNNKIKNYISFSLSHITITCLEVEFYPSWPFYFCKSALSLENLKVYGNIWIGHQGHCEPDTDSEKKKRLDKQNCTTGKITSFLHWWAISLKTHKTFQDMISFFRLIEYHINNMLETRLLFISRKIS